MDVQVRNSATGQTLTIPDDQLYALNAQWQVVSSPSDSTSQKDWSAVVGNAVYVNGRLVANESDPTKVRELAKQYPNYVGVFPAGYDFLTFGQSHGLKTDGSQSAPADPPAPTGDENGTNPDQTGWTDSMRAAYEAVKGYVDLLTSQGNMINPSVEITDELAAKFMDQAKTELGPYYEQLINQAQTDARTGYNRIQEDFRVNQEAIGREYGRSLETTQEDFASTGRTFGTQRTDAERTLSEATTRALQSNERVLERGAQDIGDISERYLGTRNLAFNATAPNMSRPVLGIPGFYDLKEQPGTSRSLFTPLGNTAGDLERSRTTAELLRQKELTALERNKRAFSTS